MNINDVLALAKAGFKASDIKELLSQPEPQPEPEKKEEVQEVKEEPAEVKQEVKEQPNEKDIEIAELKKQLAAAQKANTQQNIDDPNKPSDYDTITEIVRSFM